MPKKSGRAFAYALLLSFFAGRSYADPIYRPPIQMLVILSYDPAFPTNDDVLRALRESFPPSSYNLSIEYMDAKRLPRSQSAELLGKRIQLTLSRLGVPDLVFTVDDAALHFALDRRSSYFPGVPIVFCGVNDRDLAQSMEEDPLATGIVEAVSIRETVEIAIRTRPRIRALHALVDSTETGEADLRNLRDLSLGIPLAILDFSAMPELDYYAAVASVPPDDAFLLISAYAPRAGRPLNFSESLDRILVAAEAPVFHLWKHGVGEGVVGGKVESHYEQVRAAASVALRILDGVPPRVIPVRWESPNVYLFDWNVLMEHGMDPRLLPPDSEFLNKPPTFRQAFPDLFLALTVTAVSFVAILAMLSVILGYRLSVEKKLGRNLSLMNALINSMEEPVYLKDADGNYRIANQSFSSYLAAYRTAAAGRGASLFGDEDIDRRIGEIDAAVMESGKTRTDEFDLFYNGERKIVRMTKTPLVDTNGKPVLLGTIRDLTDERLRAETLEKMVDARTTELRDAAEKLERIAATDQLTGLANRRRMELEFAAEFARRDRYGTPISVIMADIDFFKSINDTYGHETGDAVLIDVAKTISAGSRATDLVGRWGGEEFLVLCRNENGPGTAAFAEKLRAAIEGARFLPGRRVTASFGVAECREGDTPHSLIARADENLYVAKGAGRNRVQS